MNHRRSMRIGFLAGTLGRGGAERQLAFMLRALNGIGAEVRVVCLTQGEAYESEIKELGIDVDWIGSSHRRGARLGALMQNLAARPVDILQSAHFFTNLYVAVGGRMLGIPTIGAIRNDLISEITANGAFGVWQLRLPNRLIANSELALNRALRRGVRSENIDFVRNVVGEPHSSVPERSRDRCQVLFAGRLVAQKRPELFIELASRLQRRLSESKLKFAVVGDGPHRAELEGIARFKGLRETEMSFFGEVSDMGRFYRESDILVLPSSHEGTPNVILEAMAYGVPVVATRVGGVPEIVCEGCGIMVDPNEPEELIQAVERVILDSDMRQCMAERAQEYVRKNHSIGYLQGKLEQIYSRILTKNK